MMGKQSSPILKALPALPALLLLLTTLACAETTTLSTPSCVCAFNAVLQQNELLCQATRDSNATLFSIASVVQWNCTYVKIDVSNHDVESIPGDAFESTPDLQIVHLYSDSIHNIDSKAFRGLKSLIDVDLSDNSLVTIDADLFAGNPILTKVSLSDNPLVELKQDLPILKSESITDLDLSFCKLTTVTQEMFSGLPNVKNLDLSSNDIQQMSLTALETMPKLASLDIGNNRWACGCAFRKVIEFSRSLQIIGDSSISEATIAFPIVRCYDPNRIMEVWSNKLAMKYCPDEEEDEENDSSSSEESDLENEKVFAFAQRMETTLAPSDTEDATVEIEIIIVEEGINQEILTGAVVVAVIGAFLCFVSLVVLVIRKCCVQKTHNNRASISLLIDDRKGAPKRPAYEVMPHEEDDNNFNEHLYERIPE